ncbi:hypothetical protein J1614_002152 [Plenodomus biglobosus]|nr:hypothetical protein J1614_002152 [Plenodomus biglobosus]
MLKALLNIIAYGRKRQGTRPEFSLTLLHCPVPLGMENSCHGFNKYRYKYNSFEHSIPTSSTAANHTRIHRPAILIVHAKTKLKAFPPASMASVGKSEFSLGKNKA